MRKIMYGKVIAAACIISMLGGCSWNSSEVAEQVSAAVSAAAVAAVSESETAESTSAVTTSVTSETVIFCDESVLEETSETVLSIAEPYYIEDGEPPRVFPAEEFYEFYPEVLIYAERQDVSDKVKTEVWQENLYNPEGVTAVKFYAEYPVLSGYDEEVCKKINDKVKEYIDGNFEDMQKFADELEIQNKEEIDFMIANDKFWTEMLINMDGNYFDGYGYEINGNIFTVYFSYGFGYFASAHMSEDPVPMMFDLRTGDKINFSELVGDDDKMREVFGKAECRGELLHGTVPFGERNADEISEFMKPPFNVTDTFYTDEKIAAMDGCIGFFLQPYESGSFADGVRFWRLPASEFIPYMNDEGKSLFEGYISAETGAPNVVEYKGRRWFDNTEWVPYVFDRDALTDYDREFILMFENAQNAEYYLNEN